MMNPNDPFSSGSSSRGYNHADTFQPMYATHMDQSYMPPNGQAYMTPIGHYGQAGVTMTFSDHSGARLVHPHPNPIHTMQHGGSPFLSEDGASPYDMPLTLPGSAGISPVMGASQMPGTDHIDATRYHGADLQRNQSLPLHHTAGHPMMGIQRPRSAQAVARPMPHRGHSMQHIPRPVPLHRQASLQVPLARSASPHMMAGDLFDPTPGSPIRRASSALGIPIEHHASTSPHMLPVDYSMPHEMFQTFPQGISPARAFGPAPKLIQRFSPVDETMVTPFGTKNPLDSANDVHSSGALSGITKSSSASETSVEAHTVARRDTLEVSSDDDNESPTKGASGSRALTKLQLKDRSEPASSQNDPASRGPSAAVRPQRTGGKPNVIGGRTSAKFAKVAEDPGVEGVPPGPRSMERPGPSFACIIGQAILKCSAGGLSLEHIYRYVETAYPFFQRGDGAWRNSVRHNLSIHKMFETIPRTEKFPPGKGGIWIIHEDEKCHWPEENKFIKNFPSSHPHHGTCRQTLHERSKEREAIEKAAREGRVYVPKKGKKGRKMPMKEEEGESSAMVRTSSDVSLNVGGDEHAAYLEHPEANNMTPVMNAQPLPPAPLESALVNIDDDDGEFLPEVLPPAPISTHAERLAQKGVMVPPRFGHLSVDARRMADEDENVFTSNKRMRLPNPGPPLLPHPRILNTSQQQEFVDFHDSFITPERDRPPSMTKVSSSAFKTPSLVNSSSSPGSSPMPPTIPRSQMQPSGLHHVWTHEEMDGESGSSPARQSLEAAFDFQPKAKKHLARTVLPDDDASPATSAVAPKTPLSRSSAAREAMRSPASALAKTPMLFGRSPAQAPPTNSILMSTPLWEVNGVLNRLEAYGSPSHLGRSPVPPTSPTRYAMLLGSGASPAARKMRDFTI